jgi:hypothetical protein
LFRLKSLFSTITCFICIRQITKFEHLFLT